MRLVHEYNREIVIRWMRKEHLQRIATLEKYDRQNQLSDRRILAHDYELEGQTLMYENPAKAERYFHLALEIYIAVYEDNESSSTDDISNAYYQIAQALKLQGKEKESTEVIALARKNRGPLYVTFRNAGLNSLLRPTAEPLRNEYSGICYVDLPIYSVNKDRAILNTAYNYHKNRNGIGSWDDIQYLILSDRIKELNDCSFPHCSQLEVFDSGAGVVYLGCDSFSKCPELHTVILGKSILNRSNRVFNECPKLDTVYADAAIKEQFIHAWNDISRNDGYASWFKNCPLLTSILFSDETEYPLILRT